MNTTSKHCLQHRPLIHFYRVRYVGPFLFITSSLFCVANQFYRYSLSTNTNTQIKRMLLQLISAINLMHQNYVIHRDLKTSNLLMNNRGMIKVYVVSLWLIASQAFQVLNYYPDIHTYPKVADFGLARKFTDPPVHMTELVVTLWYRYALP